ncbi:hypothetical protein [Peptoniphilus vaginalis]|uniref:hypothetical protein n=1 Tax=Peptoniphilus vaginalis TaxID=1756987 RepID=UPI001ADA7B49|nr:hypothetical protein [Peptoniphilus vaginalis]
MIQKQIRQSKIIEINKVLNLIAGDIDMFRSTMEKIVDLSGFEVNFHQVDIKDLEKYR